MVITARLQKRPQLRAVVTKPQSGGGYSEGYEAGKEAGYQDGYKAGHTAGDAEGYDRGYNLGYNNGYDTGHSMGYAEGWDAGYARGYDEGYAKGKADVEAQNAMILTDINTALVEKGAESADTLQDVPEKIGSIQAGGGDSWYDVFWDNYQQNGERTDCEGLFNGVVWNPTILRPKYNMRPKKATNMFRYCTVTDLVEHLETLGISIDFSQCTTAEYVCGNSQITHFPNIDTSSMTQLTGIFRYANALVTASLLNVRATQGWSNAFTNAFALADLTITGTIGKDISFAQSSKLSTASRKNIIYCLADLTGQTAQTITFHASVYDALDDEDKSTISAKNWNVARA